MKKLAAICVVILLSACSNSVDYEENSYIGNPYSEGTGHYAGYEWAERTGGSCNGNSDSFNEGCDEYYLQINK